MNNLSAMLLADYYKLSHRVQYPKGTEVVYSTWTPRESRLSHVDEVVVFGMQTFIKKFLIRFFNDNFFWLDKEEVVREYSRIVKNTLGIEKPETQHIEDLHDLGYLPLSIKALPEGARVPVRTPIMTIQNTNPKFFWLTNYIESLASCEMWQMVTSATIAYQYRKLFDKYGMKTVGNTDFSKFQGHDFSFRGMSSLHSAAASGMGHLLSFVGTDTIPGIQAAEEFYGANVEKELVGCSIPATEHSVQCAYGDDMEYLTKMITEVHPNGFVSVVSDGYDFWDVIGRVLPALKDKIMARNGRLVIRPDSGDPVKIVIGDESGAEGVTELERKGAIEALWDLFGGTTSPQGYKVLDSHIGLIYGDAITYDRAKAILEGLAAKGFASTNVVFGIGSYTYQHNTRDTFGFALKSTACVVNGKEIQIFKDPKTDNGVKKSQKGRVAVFKRPDSYYWHVDGYFIDADIPSDQLVEIYRNGCLLVDHKFSEIRDRLLNNKEMVNA